MREDSPDPAVGRIRPRGEVDRVDAQHSAGQPGIQPGCGQIADAEVRLCAEPQRLLAAHRLGGEADPYQQGPVRAAISRP